MCQGCHEFSGCLVSDLLPSRWLGFKLEPVLCPAVVHSGGCSGKKLQLLSRQVYIFNRMLSVLGYLKSRKTDVFCVNVKRSR